MAQDVSGRTLREAALSASPTAPVVAALPGNDQPRGDLRRTIAMHTYRNGGFGEQTLGLVRVRSPYIDGYVIEHWDRVFYPTALEAKAGFRCMVSYVNRDERRAA